MVGKAHKKLAELHSKLGNSASAMQNLESLIGIVFEDENKQGQAEATLKLGLLNYKENLITLSVNNLKKHFAIAKNMGDGSLVDSARVNLGIAESQQHFDQFKKLVMKNELESTKNWE